MASDDGPTAEGQSGQETQLRPMTDETPHELRERVEQLEDELQRLKPADEPPEAVEDDKGNRWTLGSLQSLGLTRREATVVLALLASGVALREAFVRTVVATPGDGGETVVGSNSNRDSYYVDELDALAVAADEITGGPTLFTDWELIDSGSKSVSSNNTKVVVDNFSLSNLNNIILGSVHGDPSEASTNSTNIDFVSGDDMSTTGNIGYNIRADTDGDFLIFLENTASNAFTIYYAFWEITP